MSFREGLDFIHPDKWPDGTIHPNPRGSCYYSDDPDSYGEAVIGFQDDWSVEGGVCYVPVSQVPELIRWLQEVTRMTTYFAAPDGHGDDTLWADSGDPEFPQPIIRRRDIDFPGMAHHWGEIVARVTAGNLSATEQWALDRAGRMEVLRDAMVYGDSALVVNPPSTPALDRAARLEHIQGQIIANAVTEAEFRGRLDRAVGEAWAAGYGEAEYERNQAE